MVGRKRKGRAGWSALVLTDVECCKMVPDDAEWCVMLLIGLGWYEMVGYVANWSRVVWNSVVCC